jgi:hypothetical protein
MAETVYITRNGGGAIKCFWRVKPAEDHEEIAEDHADVVAFLAQPLPSIDRSNSDNQERAIKALALMIGQVGGLTNAQVKALFKQKWDLLG